MEIAKQRTAHTRAHMGTLCYVDPSFQGDWYKYLFQLKQFWSWTGTIENPK